jgi:hypothetical protein
MTAGPEEKRAAAACRRTGWPVVRETRTELRRLGAPSRARVSCDLVSCTWPTRSSLTRRSYIDRQTLCKRRPAQRFRWSCAPAARASASGLRSSWRSGEPTVRTRQAPRLCDRHNCGVRRRSQRRRGPTHARDLTIRQQLPEAVLPPIRAEGVSHRGDRDARRTTKAVQPI